MKVQICPTLTHRFIWWTLCPLWWGWVDFVLIVCQMKNLHLQGRRWVEGGIWCHELGQWTLTEYILVGLVEIPPPPPSWIYTPFCPNCLLLREELWIFAAKLAPPAGIRWWGCKYKYILLWPRDSFGGHCVHFGGVGWTLCQLCAKWKISTCRVAGGWRVAYYVMRSVSRL